MVACATSYRWRVGGAAVALGIGAAVATGLAASASAAPSTSAAGNGDAASATGEPPVLTRGPKARNQSRTVSLAAASTAHAGPAAPVARTSRAPVGNAVAAALPWRDPRGRLITIYKGTHFAIPNNFGFFVRQVTGTGTFTANTAYDLGDNDQYDWNKFTGIAFTPLEPDRNSAMIGWRFNLTSGEFEIAPFYNVNRDRILPNENTEVISVPADATFQYTVDYTGVTVSYNGATVSKPYPEGLTPNVWTAARVSGWFGGNRAAPRTISYFIKFA